MRGEKAKVKRKAHELWSSMAMHYKEALKLNLEFHESRGTTLKECICNSSSSWWEFVGNGFSVVETKADLIYRLEHSIQVR